MNKLICALAFALSVGAFAVGCGGSDNNGNQDLAQASDLAGNPDLGPSCFSGTPMTNLDFLNACTQADSVNIDPFYPTNAPNGVLPALQ